MNGASPLAAPSLGGAHTSRERRAVNMFHWLTATALALSTAPTIAASTGPFSPQRLSDIDKTLGSDAFEGRGPATRAETKTIDYIADQFKAAGLKPAGDMVNGQRSWFQNVPLL